jgi:uncharacterized protein with HEPN domain
MSERSDLEHLEDVLEAARRAIAYCAGMTYDAFAEDTRTQDAVVRNMEILGEAAKCLSETARKESPSVPWKSIAGMRDRLIHNYFGVNWDIVWGVVTNDLPRLMADVETLLAKMRQKDR